jgi:hypothetical protein
MTNPSPREVITETLRGNFLLADAILDDLRSRGFAVVPISPIEVRNDQRGELDEVVARGCDFHLEQMGDGCWWMSVGRGNTEYHIRLFTKRDTKIHAICEDESRASEGTAPAQSPKDT